MVNGAGRLRVKISIHAPAKGATKTTLQQLHAVRISIHAPAKGATASDIHCCNSASDFNSRSREGSDSQPFAKYAMSAVISIHAPAKGATRGP